MVVVETPFLCFFEKKKFYALLEVRSVNWFKIGVTKVIDGPCQGMEFDLFSKAVGCMRDHGLPVEEGYDEFKIMLDTKIDSSDLGTANGTYYSLDKRVFLYSPAVAEIKVVSIDPRIGKGFTYSLGLLRPYVPDDVPCVRQELFAKLEKVRV